jgi:exodeoxyribonuclease VII small subunit
MSDAERDPPEAGETDSFESMVERLEALVERLENEELPLEDALAAYQEGVRLARAGHARLDAAERRLRELRGESLVDVEPDPS